MSIICPFTLRTNLEGATLRQGHFTSTIHVADVDCDKEEVIYGKSGNWKAKISQGYCGDVKSKPFSILKHRSEITLGPKGFISCSVSHMSIGLALVSMELVRYFNYLKTDRVAQDPTYWRQEIIKNHTTMLIEDYQRKKKPYDRRLLKKRVTKTVISQHYCEIIFRHLFWTTWYPSLLKISKYIYQLGTMSMSFDVSFGSRNVYEHHSNLNKMGLGLPDVSRESNNSATKPVVTSKTKVAGLQQYVRCEFGYLSILNDYGLILDLWPTPKCSEAHEFLVPALVYHVIMYLKYSKYKLNGIQFKTDGLMANIRIHVKIAEYVTRYAMRMSSDDDNISKYDIDEFTKACSTSTDAWHMNNLWWKKKILNLSVNEDNTAYEDLWSLTRFVETNAIPPKVGSHETVVEYLVARKHIYGHPTILTKVQAYVSSVLLLKYTRHSDNRQAATQVIQDDEKQQQNAIKKALGHAFTHVLPQHLRYYMTLVVGLQTFKQATKNQTIKNEVQKGDTTTTCQIPALAAPHSCTYIMAHWLGIEPKTLKHMDDKGCHSLDELIGNYRGHRKFGYVHTLCLVVLFGYVHTVCIVVLFGYVHTDFTRRNDTNI